MDCRRRSPVQSFHGIAVPLYCRRVRRSAALVFCRSAVLASIAVLLLQCRAASRGPAWPTDPRHAAQPQAVHASHTTGPRRTARAINRRSCLTAAQGASRKPGASTRTARCTAAGRAQATRPRHDQGPAIHWIAAAVLLCSRSMALPSRCIAVEYAVLRHWCSAVLPYLQVLSCSRSVALPFCSILPYCRCRASTCSWAKPRCRATRGACPASIAARPHEAVSRKSGGKQAPGPLPCGRHAPSYCCSAALAAVPDPERRGTWRSRPLGHRQGDGRRWWCTAPRSRSNSTTQGNVAHV